MDPPKIFIDQIGNIAVKSSVSVFFNATRDFRMRKLLISSTFLLCFLLLSSEGNCRVRDSAEMGECTPETSQQICELDHRFQIGANYTYAWVTPEQNLTTDGSLGGLQALYEYCPSRSIYLGGAFSYRIGSTSNDVTTRDLQDFNQQLRIGYTLNQDDYAVRCTLFTGVGARYMPEVVKANATSLDFDYTTFYVPLGFLAEKRISSRFSLGCNFQWMPNILPMVRIQPLSGAQWDLTYQLANFFVEFPIKMFFCNERYAFSVNPFYETWRDGSSTAITQTGLPLNLPGNKYTFTGVNLNFIAAF